MHLPVHYARLVHNLSELTADCALAVYTVCAHYSAYVLAVCIVNLLREAVCKYREHYKCAQWNIWFDLGVSQERNTCPNGHTSFKQGTMHLYFVQICHLGAKYIAIFVQFLIARCTATTVRYTR